MIEIEQIHTNPLSPLGSTPWAWEIPVYLFLGGLTAGLMILSALLAKRFGASQLSRWGRLFPFVGPILLSLGMLALFLDLSYKSHVYRFYLALRVTAPMSWGAWILLAIYPAALLYGLALLKEEEVEWVSARSRLPLIGESLARLIRAARRFAADKQELLARTNIALGILVGGYTGVLLSTLAARSAWNSSILGPLFLVSGFSTGAALMMLFPLTAGERHFLRNADLGAIGAELLLIGLFVLGLAAGGSAQREAAELFLGGRFTAQFWALVVIGGLLVPLVIEAIEIRKHLRHTAIAPLMLLVGGFSLRWILVAAGQLP